METGEIVSSRRSEALFSCGGAVGPSVHELGTPVEGQFLHTGCPPIWGSPPTEIGASSTPVHRLVPRCVWAGQRPEPSSAQDASTALGTTEGERRLSRDLHVDRPVEVRIRKSPCAPVRLCTGVGKGRESTEMSEVATLAGPQDRGSAALLLLDPTREFRDLVVGGTALRHLAGDLLVGVHDRRVVASAELLADLR